MLEIRILKTYIKDALTYKVISTNGPWILEEYDPWIDEPLTEEELKIIQKAMQGPWKEF